MMCRRLASVSVVVDGIVSVSLPMLVESGDDMNDDDDDDDDDDTDDDNDDDNDDEDEDDDDDDAMSALTCEKES